MSCYRTAIPWPCGRLLREAEIIAATREASVHTIRREMTISHKEFDRILKMAFKREFKTVRSDQSEFENSDNTINLKLSAESSKKIGSINIPITELCITFMGVTEEQKKDFMIRFDRAFQRGGG